MPGVREPSRRRCGSSSRSGWAVAFRRLLAAGSSAFVTDVRGRVRRQRLSVKPTMRPVPVEVDGLIDERSSNEELLERISAIGRELSVADGLQATLQRIVDLGQDILEHCDGVSMMLIGRGGVIDSPAYSSSVAYESDLAQYATGQGPCLGAIEQQETVIDDLETDQRWPDYRARALELGLRSMISVRLLSPTTRWARSTCTPSSQTPSTGAPCSWGRCLPHRRR